MRTVHQGFETPKDIPALSRVMLPIMARLKVMKTVPEREAALRKALAGTDFADHHWPELLVSKLTEFGVKESADAHILALMALREADPIGLSRIALEITPHHPLVQAFVAGMSTASPEFMDRIKTGKIDSDQIFFRCVLIHLFRRETGNVFQMFLVDAAARKFLGGTKSTIGQFVQELQSRHEDHPVPEGAWGYALVIRDVTSHMGLYLSATDAEIEQNIARLKPHIAEALGDASPERLANAMVAAGLSPQMFHSNPGGTALMLASAGRLLGYRHISVYHREDEGGGHTVILPIDAESVEAARMRAVKSPELIVQQVLRRAAELHGDEGYEGMKQ